MFEDVVARNGFVARRKRSQVEEPVDTKRMKRNQDEKENEPGEGPIHKQELQVVLREQPRTFAEDREAQAKGEVRLPAHIKLGGPFRKLPHVADLKRVRIDGDKYCELDPGPMIASAFVDIAHAEMEEIGELYKDFPEFLDVLRYIAELWDKDLRNVLGNFERQNRHFGRVQRENYQNIYERERNRCLRTIQKRYEKELEGFEKFERNCLEPQHVKAFLDQFFPGADRLDKFTLTNEIFEKIQLQLKEGGDSYQAALKVTANEVYKADNELQDVLQEMETLKATVDVDSVLPRRKIAAGYESVINQDGLLLICDYLSL